MASRVATLPSRPSTRRRISDRPAALVDWLRGQGEHVDAPLTLRRVPAGRTNSIWLVEDRAGRRWALRERERSDRRVFDREAAVIAALSDTEIPVPRLVGHGGSRWAAAFLVSAWAGGTSVVCEQSAAVLSADQRHRMGPTTVELLLRVHAVTADAAGLPAIGARHLQRQLTCISDVWTRSGSGGLHDPAWRAVRTRLISLRPADDPRAVLVHGDFRLPNVMFAGEKVSAVLDWERCTVGNPVADLAWLVNSWRGPDEPRGGFGGDPTRVGGFCGRDDLIALYSSGSAIRLDDLDYHRALAHWTAATLLQAAYVRPSPSTPGKQDSAGDRDRIIEYELVSAAALLGRRR